jgi:hypothetical protein
VTPVADRAAMEAALAQAEPSHPCFGLYDGAYAVLKLRDPAVLAELLPDRSPDWRLLDVSVLHELFIERVLGIDKETVERKTNIEYLRDPQMGYDTVDRNEAQFLLVMNPTRMAQVRDCTGAGEKMPQKSTDFYPKVVSGLVMMPIGVDERFKNRFSPGESDGHRGCFTYHVQRIASRISIPLQKLFISTLPQAGFPGHLSDLDIGKVGH